MRSSSTGGGSSRWICIARRRAVAKAVRLGVCSSMGTGYLGASKSARARVSSSQFRRIHWPLYRKDVPATTGRSVYRISACNQPPWRCGGSVGQARRLRPTDGQKRHRSCAHPLHRAPRRSPWGHPPQTRPYEFHLNRDAAPAVTQMSKPDRAGRRSARSTEVMRLRRVALTTHRLCGRTHR